MAQQVALYLQDAHTIREGMDIVKYAEEKGFHAVWQAESRLVRDAIPPMAALRGPSWIGMSLAAACEALYRTHRYSSGR